MEHDERIVGVTSSLCGDLIPRDDNFLTGGSRPLHLDDEFLLTLRAFKVIRMCCAHVTNLPSQVPKVRLRTIHSVHLDSLPLRRTQSKTLGAPKALAVPR